MGLGRWFGCSFRRPACDELLDSIYGAFQPRRSYQTHRCTTCHGPKTAQDQFLVAGSDIFTALTDDLEDRELSYICQIMAACVHYLCQYFMHYPETRICINRESAECILESAYRPIYYRTFQNPCGPYTAIRTHVIIPRASSARTLTPGNAMGR